MSRSVFVIANLIAVSGGYASETSVLLTASRLLSTSPHRGAYTSFSLTSNSESVRARVIVYFYPSAHPAAVYINALLTS